MTLGALARRVHPPMLLFIAAVLYCSSAVAQNAPAVSATHTGTQPQTDPAVIVQSEGNQSATLAASWLGSSDARTRAWGAYSALGDRRLDLLPQLIKLAGSYAGESVAGRDEQEAMLEVLDALVQMDGKLPAEEAAKLYSAFPVQSLILLDRAGPDASGFLLDIFRGEDRRMAPAIHYLTDVRSSFATEQVGQSAANLAWLAAGDLLMMRRPAGFAAAVFRGFTVEVEVFVADKGTILPPGPGWGSSCSGGLPPPRVGWPPVANYSFVLAGGSDPSFYKRIVGGTYANEHGEGLSACGWMPAPDVLREHFLENLAAMPRDSVRAANLVTIRWRDSRQYGADIRAVIDREEAVLDKLGSDFVRAGVISAEEKASARPGLLLRISDERSKKRSSLPDLLNTENNVRIVRISTD